jgi:ABC-type transport system involved in multi-copper enzyme maturation permease subunit
MLWMIVRKELLANILSLRFLLILLLCCTLILVSAYTMRGKYEKRVQEYSAAIKTHRQELAERDGKRGNPNTYRLDKPLVPLSVFVEGMEGSGGRFATVGILSTPKLEGISGSDPGLAYFGTLDMLFIVRVVLSLVAILLTYDSLSGEREQGTLKLIFANSVPRASILVAKCIGGYITLLLPFLIPMLIALLILISSSSLSFSSEDWARLGLIFLVSLLYIGFFLMLGLLVSSRSNRSNSALMMLLFLWVVFVLAIPKVSTIVADKLSNIPSIQTIQAEKDAVAGQMWSEYRQWGERFRQEHKEMSPEHRREMVRMQGETGLAISERRWQIQAEYDKQKTAQYQLAAHIARISPASVLCYAAIGLAGTGFERQEAFLAAARSYQIGVASYYYDAFHKQQHFELARLPIFEFHEASFSESWSMVWADMLTLLLLVLCFFMLTYISFLRRDVR